MKEKVFFIILAVAFFLATALLAHAWADAEGFLGLKWGMSEEEARKVFNDLKLKDKRSERPDVLQPWNGYVRENETFQLGELPTEVNYVFSEKGLDAVVARATFMDLNWSSVPGKYINLKEKFLSSYVVLKKQFVSVYGEPELIENDNYICRWKLKQTNIMLSFGFDDISENYINLVLCYSYKPEVKDDNKPNPQKKK